MADQISDAILDACLEQDPYSPRRRRDAYGHWPCGHRRRDSPPKPMSISRAVAAVIASIGYDNALYGFDGQYDAR